MNVTKKSGGRSWTKSARFYAVRPHKKRTTKRRNEETEEGGNEMKVARYVGPTRWARLPKKIRIWSLVRDFDLRQRCVETIAIDRAEFDRPRKGVK